MMCSRGVLLRSSREAQEGTSGPIQVTTSVMLSPRPYSVRGVKHWMMPFLSFDFRWG